MLKTKDANQLKFEAFKTPFEIKMNRNNRWVRLSEILPWDELIGIYSKSMSDFGGQGVEFNSDLSSPTFIFSPVSVGSGAAYLLGNFSKLLFSGKSEDYMNIIDHVLEGGKINFDLNELSFSLFNEKGEVIKKVFINNPQNKANQVKEGNFIINPIGKEKNTNYYYHRNFSVPVDNTAYDGRNPWDTGQR